jgi:O-antigen ligase
MSLTALTYDMVFSYLMLVPMIILSYKLLFIRFKLSDVVLVIFAIITVVIVGSRGPLLSYFVYLLLLFVNFVRINRFKAKSFVLVVASTIIISTFMLNLNSYVSQFNNQLIKLGIQSRTIYLLLGNNIDFLTGRSEIFADTVNKILLNPILGYGIGGDRVFLNGTYPHNIFLELFTQFGIVLGGFICLLLITYWVIGIFLNKSPINQHLAIIFAGIGLISLFSSGSYLTSSNFWLFMAICVSSVHSYRKELIGYFVTFVINQDEEIGYTKQN